MTIKYKGVGCVMCDANLVTAQHYWNRATESLEVAGGSKG